MNVAIIPARGGSKRISKKNIKMFYGKPMLAWSIEAAKNSMLFDEIIVSSDDEEIIEIALSHGAKAPFKRPDDISDDYTLTSTVIKHAIQNEYFEKYNLKAVCCIYATAPFLIPEDLKKGLTKFNSENWEYVFSATEYSSSIYRAFKKNENDGVNMVDANNFSKRSQDLEITFHDAAQFYWGSPSAWVDEKNFFTPNSSFIHLPKWRVVDIDTEADLKHAELIAPYIFKKINKDSEV